MGESQRARLGLMQAPIGSVCVQAPEGTESGATLESQRTRLGKMQAPVENVYFQPAKGTESGATLGSQRARLGQMQASVENLCIQPAKGLRRNRVYTCNGAADILRSPNGDLMHAVAQTQAPLESTHTQDFFKRNRVYTTSAAFGVVQSSRSSLDDRQALRNALGWPDQF